MTRMYGWTKNVKKSLLKTTLPIKDVRIERSKLPGFEVIDIERKLTRMDRKN